MTLEEFLRRGQAAQQVVDKAIADPRNYPCASCGAKAGSPCKRPSGHNVFGGGFHSQRMRRAKLEAANGGAAK